MIRGLPVRCGGVRAFVQPILDIAMASPGVILSNPHFFGLPPKLQLFIYSHECAHRILGSNEASDCWAIRTGRDLGWFLQDHIAYPQAYFGRSSGDWTHAPGPLRVSRMATCYGLR